MGPMGRHRSYESYKSHKRTPFRSKTLPKANLCAIRIHLLAGFADGSRQGGQAHPPFHCPKTPNQLVIVSSHAGIE